MARVKGVKRQLVALNFYQLQASDTLDAEADGTEVGENRNLVPGCKQGVGGRLTGNLVGTAWQVAGPSLIQT